MKVSIVTTAPAVEPVSLSEAKAQLRIDSTNTTFDTEISQMITEARAWVESRYGISIITQSRQQRQDNFYESFDRYPLDGVASQRYYTRFPVKILFGPVQSVDSVKYYDTNGVQQTLVLNTDYSAAGLVTPTKGLQQFPVASIYPVNSWPSFKWIPESVQINYTAGWGSDSTYVPGPVKRAIKYVLGHFFENRLEESTTENRLLIQLQFGCDRIMSLYQDYQQTNIYA